MKKFFKKLLNTPVSRATTIRVMFLVLGGMILTFLFQYYTGFGSPRSTPAMDHAAFFALLKDHKLTDVALVSLPDGERILSGSLDAGGGKTRTVQINVDLAYDHDLKHDLAAMGYSHVDQYALQESVWLSLLPYIPSVLFTGLALVLIFSPNTLRKGLMSFGKRKLNAMEESGVRFSDVAGIDESKESLKEVVEFLKDPKRFHAIGAHIPKGVLMIGPPGTGKTMLAKAMAGEANVPFYPISGSDFVEMFVGVGASRVRDIFEQGKKSAPCLIFIDEIDAVGRARSAGGHSGHDEREQTLNALLVEMDGIGTEEGVIIIAATNRKDVLDKALLRPGRFDREVHVRLPDVRGREAILKVHAKNVKIDNTVNLHEIARGTPGFSGAELANLINEGALIAASGGETTVSQKNMNQARDQVRWGRELRSMAMSEEEKRRIAYHEAGHTILNILLPHTDPLHKVTCIPRGPGLGLTMMLPLEDQRLSLKNKNLSELVLLMGGRAAEEHFLGDVSNGATGDLSMATNLAEHMYLLWGMFPEVNFRSINPEALNQLSSEHKSRIDQAITGTILNSYKTAVELILANQDKTKLIAETLIERETMDAIEVYQLIGMTPPAGILAAT